MDSPFDDYVAAITDLTRLVAEADHEAAESRQTLARRLESVDADLSSHVQSLQQRATDLAVGYGRSARELRSIQRLDFELPAQVRPITTLLTVDQASASQHEAEDKLRRAVRKYESASTAETHNARAAAAALAARHASLRTAEQPNDPASSRFSNWKLSLTAICAILFAASVTGALGFLAAGVPGVLAGPVIALGLLAATLLRTGRPG